MFFMAVTGNVLDFNHSCKSKINILEFNKWYMIRSDWIIHTFFYAIFANIQNLFHDACILCQKGIKEY